MKVNKVLAWVIMSVIALTGSVFATPITVTDFNIQKDNGDYLLLVSLENANVSTGTFDEVSFTIEELGTTFNSGVVKLDTTDVVVLSYNLADVTDSYDQLKKGESYRVTVETSTNSMTEAFLYGSEKDTDGLDLILEEISINSNRLESADSLQVKAGETLDIDLRMSALESFDDARLRVFLDGYEHDDLSVATDIFAVVEGKTYIKSLSLALPADMDNQQDHILRIVGANDLSGVTYKEFSVYVDTDRHKVDVLDLVMTPSSGVEAGQNIIANVRMKNRGQKAQDSVKVSVSIPELNVVESSYISNLNSDEVATSDDMMLFVPENAAAGSYEVLATLSYDDGYTTTEEAFNLNVLAAKTVEEENLLVSFKNNIALGETSTFEVVVANPNENSKPISLVPVENAWSTVEVSPTLAMVQGGTSATFVVTVDTRAGAVGEKDLALVVKEGAETVNEFTVNTFVELDESVEWLNIALVVLLVLAIIVLLSLVVSIAKKKNNDDDEELSSEEYY